ncbi:MAG: hypothetical protein FK734_08520 [Asgard group archaeon]|nr:hypothetical protein [Asgard group archaeon]
MKLLIFSSCSKRKVIEYPHQPSCDDLTSKERREDFIIKLSVNRPAHQMYLGALNLSIKSAIKVLRRFFDVSHYIVSAGFGIIEETVEIPPYDCTFSTMSKEDIEKRAELLTIPNDYHEIIEKEKPDCIYLALGKKYLDAIGSWDKDLPCKTIAFDDSDNNLVITLPADHIAVQEASFGGGLPIHGVVGYKGDLLLLTTNYLVNSDKPDIALKELLDNPNDFKYVINSLRNY